MAAECAFALKCEDMLKDFILRSKNRAYPPVLWQLYFTFLILKKDGKQAISPYPFLPIFATGGHDLHLRVYTSPFRAPSPPLPLLAERHDGHLIGQPPKKSAGLLLTPVSRSTQSAKRDILRG